MASSGSEDEAVEQLVIAAEEFEGFGAARHRSEVESGLRRLGHTTAYHRSTPGKGTGSGIEALIGRELEVAQLVLDRRTNREIAKVLLLGTKTVESHIRNIFTKLGVSSRVRDRPATRRGSRRTRQLAQPRTPLQSGCRIRVLPPMWVSPPRRTVKPCRYGMLRRRACPPDRHQVPERMAGMTPSPLSRVAGPIALGAGAMVVVTRLVSALTTPRDAEALAAYVLTPTHAINSVASIVAFALLALALVAVYEREANEAAAAGTIAFGAALVGIVFMAGDWWYEAFAVPRIGELAPQLFDTFVGGRLQIGGVSSFVLFGIGWAMFGVASLRAHVLPGALSATILVSGILSGVPVGVLYLSGQVILGLAIVWLGAWMLRSPVIASTAVESPRRPQQPAA